VTARAAKWLAGGAVAQLGCVAPRWRLGRVADGGIWLRASPEQAENGHPGLVGDEEAPGRLRNRHEARWRARGSGAVVGEGPTMVGWGCATPASDCARTRVRMGMEGGRR
jgi:hypothetical protein